MGHLSSPLKNQMDILQTLTAFDRCLMWIYTPGEIFSKKYKAALVISWWRKSVDMRRVPHSHEHNTNRRSSYCAALWQAHAWAHELALKRTGLEKHETLLVWLLKCKILDSDSDSEAWSWTWSTISIFLSSSWSLTELGIAMIIVMFITLLLCSKSVSVWMAVRLSPLKFVSIYQQTSACCPLAVRCCLSWGLNQHLLVSQLDLCATSASFETVHTQYKSTKKHWTKT